MELPEGLNSDELNRRLFKHGAAILKGFDCDMARPSAASFFDRPVQLWPYIVMALHRLWADGRLPDGLRLIQASK